MPSAAQIQLRTRREWREGDRRGEDVAGRGWKGRERKARDRVLRGGAAARGGEEAWFVGLVFGTRVGERERKRGRGR